ncbi:cupin domain-containing protein [Haloferula sargassicola]|uniref:ChrR-like cupin domain-containing protein n=1 Tax=Haloferula sargassicola TaxID=490096 RepID=A0ABP9UVM8_9BACT
MNHPPSKPDPRDLAEEFGVMTALGALDGPDAAAMEHCDECPFSQAARSAMGYDESVAAMASAAFAPVDPPADLKAGIMARIQADKLSQKDAPLAGFHFLRHDEGEWTPLPGGKIRLKVISDFADSPHTLILLEADPGGVFFPHAHKGTEEVYMISGDLETEGRVMGPGDYLRSAPGTRHHKAVSHQGCRALMITARQNHPRRTYKLYQGLVRSLRSLRGKSHQAN